MEQVKQFARERFFQLLLMLVVAIGLGLYLSIFTPWSADAAVSNVELEDNDNQGYGFDGRDFSVSWNIDQDPPAGYQQTQVFIVPTATNLTVGTLNTACEGEQCIALCNFNQYNQTNCGLPPFVSADSNDNVFSTSTEYVAWVFVSSTVPELVSSTPFQGQFDTPEDNNAPFVDHVSANTAVAGQDALLYAFIFDDQTDSAAFDNLVDGEAEFGLFYYGEDVSDTYSTTTLNQVQDNLFVFTIPAVDVPVAGQTFEYYIEVGDRAGNIEFIAAGEDVDNMNEAEASPFVVNVINGGVRTVTGGLTNLDNFAVDGWVVPGGLAVGAVETENGEFTISNLPNNVGFEVVATAQNHCNDSRSIVLHTENVIDINLRLRQGQCGFFEGGEGGEPQVMFSGPPQGARGVPPGETIRIGFNQLMAGNTINSNSPEANGSAIYLTGDGGQTRLAGQVTWCQDNLTAGCENIPQQDRNVILFNPTNDLEQSTQYALVIDESVTAENGRCIRGNREGCGFILNFVTGGENLGNDENFEFGGNGQFMPPFVRAMIPGPGFRAAPNTNILLEFNQSMDGDTITANNIQLSCGGEDVNTALSLDNSEQRMVTINPGENLDTGECIVNVLGAVASAQGIALRPQEQAQENAFHAFFEVSGNADETPPTIFPLIEDGATGVAVNTKFEFGLSELPLPTSVLNASNITLKRGSTSVSKSVEFDPAGNRLLLVPDSALTPNTLYTIKFTTSVADLAGNALEQPQTFTYTTGAVDATAPTLAEARCDDFQCRVGFSEPMNHKTQIDGEGQFAPSVLNHENITLTIDGGEDVVVAQTNLNWDAMHDELIIEGLGLNPQEAIGDEFTLTVAVTAEDLSGNAISAGARSAQGEIEDGRQNFGVFGDAGMFGPPGGAGEEHRPEGFGSFSAEQFAFGGAAIAFPFNQVAGQDSGVFHIEFKPDLIIQDGDQLVFAFPNGTTVTDAEADTQSPFFRDMNEFGPGTIGFDTDFDGDGVQVDAANRKVTVQVNVVGNPVAGDRFIVDIRRIVTSPIPKGPESGGSTVDIKVLRAGQVIVNKTTMPFFTTQAGSRSIAISIFAGSQAEPVAGANGTMSMFVGGPNGHPIQKDVTLTNGVISAVNGAATTTVRLTQLSDGCYFIGTEPFVTLGGNEYFGKDRPETVCVDANNAAATQNIVLAAASGDGAVTTTIQFADGVNFNGEDIDIFAGGPGRFVVKTVEDVGAPGTYTLRLPKDGSWFIGFGPAHAKSGVAAVPRPLPCMTPPPIDLRVSGVGGQGGAVSAGFHVPPGVTFNDDTDTITFSCTTADKTVTGRVLDGEGNGLANVEVFMHTQGFGAPIFGSTNASGTFNLAVAELGSYEIGAFKAGLPPVFRNIEIRPDGNDAGNDPDIYFKGAQITDQNPLILQMKKGGLTISGKMFDASNNPIVGAPIFAVNSSTKEFIPGGMTGAGGAYTVFVSAGTWVIRAELPPDKSDSCGTFSRTVTISQETGNQSNQNLTSSASSCYTLGGSVDVGGEAQGNAPIFIEAWDTDNDRPAGGFFRMVSTNESGTYTAEVPGNTTYRVGTFDPDFGELSITQAVVAADVENADITSGDTGTITFQFTGGNANMNAFIEVKKNNDRHTRFSKPVNGLAQNPTMTVKEGTYDYFVDVFGFGKFTGTVQTGNTATIDLSGSSFITISGNAKDADNADGNNLIGALLTFRDTNGIVRTAVTDESGNYSVKIKAGTWNVALNQAGFISTGTSSVAFAASTANFDVGGATPDINAPSRAPYIISGTIYESDGETAMTKGFVEAQSAAGKVVATPVDSNNGTYNLPVINGTWTIRAQGPRHAKTTRGSTVTINGASQENINLTLDADATRQSKSSSGSIAADNGGAIDDTENSGVRLVAGAGVLESGDGDVTVSVERDYTAPTTESFDPLGDASFEISATGDSTIKNLNGNAEVVIDYTDLLDELAEGEDEGDLQLMYYSPERDEYVPVEGGFVVDEENNTVTGLVNHFTAFVVGVPNDNSQDQDDNDNQNNNQGGGGGGFTPRNTTQQTGVNPPALPTATTQISQQTVAQEYSVNSPVAVQVGASHHTVTVLSATESQAMIKIQSEPITVTVLKNESKDVDTDNDGVADLKVQYTGLNNGKASVTMVNLTDSGEASNAVTINAGAYQTTSRVVTLKFNVPAAREFAVSNVSDFTGVVFHAYTPTTTWTLSAGDGQKTVYVRFRSAEGGTSDANDAVTLAGQGFVQQPAPTPTPVQCALTAGKAYKEAGSKAIWYITSQCTKRPFNNPRVFFTYFSSWNDVLTTTKEMLAKVPTDGLGFMPWGPSYDPQYGALVKIVNDPKVYLLLGTKRHWIASEGVFTALKYAWTWIEDVSQELLDKYESAGEITSTTEHPAYTLIKYKNSNKVYRLEPDASNPGRVVRRHVKDEATFESLDYRWDRIVTVDEAEQYTDGDQIDYSKKIYIRAR